MSPTVEKVERNEHPTKCQGDCGKYFGAAEILRARVNRAFRSLCLACFERAHGTIEAYDVKPPRNWPDGAPLPPLRRGHVSGSGPVATSEPSPPASVSAGPFVRTVPPTDPQLRRYAEEPGNGPAPLKLTAQSVTDRAGYWRVEAPCKCLVSAWDTTPDHGAKLVVIPCAAHRVALDIRLS